MESLKELLQYVQVVKEGELPQVGDLWLAKPEFADDACRFQENYSHGYVYSTPNSPRHSKILRKDNDWGGGKCDVDYFMEMHQLLQRNGKPVITLPIEQFNKLMGQK